MTLEELRDALCKLTPEQLARDAVWVGDERGGKIKSVWIAEEDHLGDCMSGSMPRSDLGPDEQDGHICIPRGAVQLVVD